MKIAVSGGGSYVGIAQASQGAADLGDSDVVAPGNAGLVDHKVAVVGFGLISNPSSGVSNLSFRQIRDIFAGRIANWNQVGGKDQSIVVINRPRSSGTVVTTVGSTPGSISYVSLGYTKNKPVTVLRINGVAATDDNIRTGRYPIWSYEHIFARAKSSNRAADDFIRYIMSNKEDIEKLGFIQINTMRVRENNR